MSGECPKSPVEKAEPALREVSSRTSSLVSQRYFWLAAGVWTLALAGSLGWNLARHRAEVESLAAQTARALFEKDLMYRLWNAQHGGVYAAVSGDTPPNPLLHVAERDLVTPSGRKLTLINPAYMVRQVFELQQKKLGMQSHITSLKPIRPENQPDLWERAALESFAQGAREVTSVAAIGTEPHLRLMRPLVTEQSCLQCHGDQGYCVGDVRGGISVAVPLRRFSQGTFGRNLVLAHGALWGLGLAGLSLGWNQLRRQVHERQRAELEGVRLEGRLQNALAEVNTLHGLLPICASCKKIRDDQGYWNQIEAYIQARSSAAFSHGICPDCLQRLYGEYLDREADATRSEHPEDPSAG
jgi:hypothetical protein